MSVKPLLLCVLVVMVAPCLRAFEKKATPEQLAFFDEQVFPILKEHCFGCHGEDDKMKGDLRLTSREGLLHGGALGSSYNAEAPEESLLLAMVSYKDSEHEMPPKAKLADDKIAVLKKWIEMGALYNPEKEIRGPLVQRGRHVQPEDFEYWAYRPVTASTEDSIDTLIDQRLQNAEIPANGRASRGTLIRRAYYNLIGLPPTPSEVDQFVNDSRAFPVVWEELISELLARPQYGEKWARHWLDLVRYAETNGFERDNPKPEIWRYRDYVINAFNADKPYDQFIIEQLAGDEIDHPTMESIAATGFFRLMQWDDEPADRKQHTYDVLADNVAITTETFLGSTVGCARCHDHKADPFTQKDYYSLMAFLHGVTSYATQGTMRAWASPEELTAFEAEKEKKVQRLQREIETVEVQLKAYLSERGRLNASETPNSKTFVEDARATPATWEYTFKRPTQDWKDVGYRNKSWFKGQGGFGRGAPNSKVTSEWKSSDIWMRTSFGLKVLPETLALEIYHDEDVEVYLNGVEIFKATGYVTDYQNFLLDQRALDALQTGRNVLAVHCHQTAGGQFIDLALRTSPQKAGNLNEAIRRGGKKLVEEIQSELGSDLIGERARLTKEVHDTRRSSTGVQLNAVQEHPNVAPLHVHLRGSAHVLGDPVEPAFPGVLTGSFEPTTAQIQPGFATESSSGRRRALAEWIASPDNPLTARVMVNRIWQHHFGRGIVKSASDFGELGEVPTHPELLDWLASEFVKRDWSIKEMHKLLMTSDAFLRSSAPNDAAQYKDPTNNLFWRVDMRRLTAEEIRDSILKVSGSLNPKIGGPWVYIPLPEEVLATSSRPGANWPVTKGEEAFRRSIYVHVKRSLRVPMLVDHDQADTDGHCAVRFSTTVPTQALAMLNSEFVNSQAKRFAQRCRENGADLQAQLKFGMELATQRAVTPEGIEKLEAMSETLMKDAGLKPEEAFERVALLILNLNEFVYLD